MAERDRSSQTSDEILQYIAYHGVFDKDTQRPQERRARRLRGSGTRHQVTLDLHGFTAERAAAALRESVTEARRNGYRSLLVIHGRGIHSEPEEGAVLKLLVQQMLDGELRSQVRDSRPASPVQGGDGATVIYLR